MEEKTITVRLTGLTLTIEVPAPSKGKPREDVADEVIKAVNFMLPSHVAIVTEEVADEDIELFDENGNDYES